MAPDANCASEHTTGSNSELASFSTAITDIGAFVDAIKAQQPTLTIPAIKVAAHDASQIVDSVSGGLNIISTPSVTLKTDAGLTITGNSSDLVILAIAGNLKIGADAILSTAITSSTIPEDHLIVFVGGKIVSVGKNAVLNGTIIAPKATCTLAAGAASIGAYLCGKQITMQNEDAQGDDAAILFNPTVVTLP